jgi:hypothetical protein
MKKLWIALIAPPAVVLFTWLFGELVMHLWNWLLPPILGLHMITFWQALGLLLLSRIFFGSWGSGGNRGLRGRRGRWDKMNPEEREKIRRGWAARCSNFSNTPGESKEPA